MNKAHEGKAQAEEGLGGAEHTSHWYLDDTTGAWPRRNHTSIKPLICGAAAFSEIEDAIRNAENSIEIATWGFDPSMRLKGSAVTTGENCTTMKEPIARKSCMPYTGGDLEKNPRVGDLLLWAASKNRPVRVRVLVWNDPLARLMRVDENLPESGPDGNGINPPVYRNLWRIRLNADSGLKSQAKAIMRDQKAGDFSDEELSERLIAESRRRLLAKGEVLESYKRHYKETFDSLKIARDKKKDGGLIEAGKEYPAIKTLKGIINGFSGAYWKGYTRPPLNLMAIDSPGTQVDDHYYNAEWFRLVRSANRAKKTGENPEYIGDIKVEYRGQEREVDGGNSPAMQRINKVASRLGLLTPQIQENETFQKVSKYMELFLLWWEEDEVMRPSSGAFAPDAQKAFGNTVVYLKTNDYTNLYGVRDYISEKIDNVLRIPIETLGDAIKSIDKIYELMQITQLFTAQGVRTLAATYHQKTVLIDYKSETGKAVGFVMGHNMLKNYMDDTDHKMFDSPVRYPEFGPWQDISLKVRGECLQDIANNFVESWDEGSSGELHESNLLEEDGKRKISGMAQILRTALCPGGAPPDYPDASLESINAQVAADLEEICNLIERVLGAAKTDFNKLAGEAKKQFPQTANELEKQANATIRNIDEATAGARDTNAKRLEYVKDKTGETIEENVEKAKPYLAAAQRKLDQHAPVNTSASPAVRGPDAISIYNSYLNAIHNCSTFLYTENQYFRHEVLAQKMKERALQHVAGGGGPLYWFVVTNHPVSPGEAPNTAKMLEELGQHERLGKYVRDPHDKKMLREEYQKGIVRREEIDKELDSLDDPAWHTKLWDDAKLQIGSETKKEQDLAKISKKAELEADKKQLSEKLRELQAKYPNIRTYEDAPKTVLDVEERKEAFETVDVAVGDVATKEEADILEKQGINRNDPCLKVHVATLTSCDGGVPCMYTPIYVHSKLLVVDDAFMSLGSANINIRSMHVDAEINIATDSGSTAAELRKDLFVQHAEVNFDNVSENYESWLTLMDNNWRFMHSGVKLKGFLTHFYDPETPVAKPTD